MKRIEKEREINRRVRVSTCWRDREREKERDRETEIESESGNVTLNKSAFQRASP